MLKIFRNNIIKLCIAMSFFLIPNLFGLRPAMAETLTFRVIAVNPSKTKTQEIPIKQYLPKEVAPKDIVNSGGLEIEYDPEQSIYYVYSDNVELAPSEVRVFEVEITDVWVIPEDKLVGFEEQIDSALASLEGTKYYTKAKEIADSIFPRLSEIRTSQVDDTVSRQRHIGIYRQNLITLEEITGDVAKLQKILVTAGGPPAPEMLVDKKIKAESPSKTMTWIFIFLIIIFTGFLAAVLFFTWQRQAGVTKDALSTAKKSAFPEAQEDEASDESNKDTT